MRGLNGWLYMLSFADLASSTAQRLSAQLREAMWVSSRPFFCTRDAPAHARPEWLDLRAVFLCRPCKQHRSAPLSTAQGSHVGQQPTILLHQGRIGAREA